MTLFDYLLFLYVLFVVYLLFRCIISISVRDPYHEFRDVYDEQVDAIRKTIESWKEPKP